jgi:quercetin dioxygenase-like cupin family protein
MEKYILRTGRMNSATPLFKLRKWTLFFVVTATIGCTQPEQRQSVFPPGDPVSPENFTGTVRARVLLPNDSVFQCAVFSVMFEKGARTNWHRHPAGQILLVIDGEGLHQLQGQPVQVIKKGDVIVCPPGGVHWHGASPGRAMNHIAINPNTEHGLVQWLERVSEEEYAAPRKP